MSTENTKTEEKPLAAVDNAGRFIHKPGPKYHFKGKTYDLRTIDTQTAEALANDGSCAFLQWKDVGKRPKDQRNPLDVPEGPRASNSEKAKP